MLPLLLLLLVAVPIGWFASEFSKYRALRIALGIVAIATTTFGVCAVNDLLTSINYNISYGNATKKLVQTSIAQIEDGHLDRVVKTRRRMDVQYDATYEMPPSKYVQLTEDAIAQMAGSIPIDARLAGEQTAPK